MKKIFGNKILFGILAGVFALLFIALIVGTNISFYYQSAVNEFLGIKTSSVDTDGEDYFKSDFETETDLINYEKELCAEVEREGAVLLRNNGALPLSKTAKVSCLSRSSVNMVYGGTGSGQVNTSAAPKLKDALEGVGMTVNPTLWNAYRDSTVARVAGTMEVPSSTKKMNIGEVAPSFYSSRIVSSFSDYDDAAIVVISRTGGEGYDLPTGSFSNGKNGYLALQDYERSLLELANENFDKVIVLINASNAIELGWLEEYDIDAALWIGAVGQTGLYGVADVLAGVTNPSGHLVDTYAADSQSAPAMVNHGSYVYTNQTNSNEWDCRYTYVVEAENIYVGYKYYETRYEDSVLGRGNAKSEAGVHASSNKWNYSAEVTYPFGFGMSYTSFEQTLDSVSVNADDRTAELTVTVKNTGSVAGKDVVEAYFQSEYTQYDKTNGVEKPAVALCGFKKTKTLAPDESETLKITVEFDEIASYDYRGNKTYILEAGSNYFAIGNDSHDALNNILAKKGYDSSSSSMTADGDTDNAYLWQLAETITLDKSSTDYDVTNNFDKADLNYYQSGAVTYLSRSDWSGTYPVTYEVATNAAMISDLADDSQYTGGTAEKVVTGATTDNKLISMRTKAIDDDGWDAILDQLTIAEMAELIGNGGYRTAPIVSIAYPGTTDLDGPAGISSFISGASCMAYTAEVVMASTWNVDILESVGKCIGEDGLSSGTHGWYAPGVNIHRTPYSGRNYEYFSEDGFLSGKLAAKEISGVQSKGVFCYTKHFALNEQETHRQGVNMWANEQAIREVYLRAFQFAVEDGNSHAIMTSFNRIGCIWAGAHKGLLVEVLRNEWGFTGHVITDYAGEKTWMSYKAGLEAGNDLWLSSGAYFKGKLNTEGATDNYLLSLMRKASRNILYSGVNSSTMNGVNESTNVTIIMGWWQPLLIVIDVVIGLLAGASIVLLVLKIREGSKIIKGVQNA